MLAQNETSNRTLVSTIPAQTNKFNKIDETLKEIHRNDRFHLNFRNRIDMNFEVFDVILGVGLKRQDGTYLSNSEANIFIQKTEEYTARLKSKNSHGVDVLFFKSVLRFIFTQSAGQSNAAKEIEYILDVIFEEFKCLLDVVRMLSSIDDKNRMRYAGGMFALSNQSFFTEAVSVYGMSKTEQDYNKYWNVINSLRYLKIYELVLITINLVLELSKSFKHRFSEESMKLIYNVWTRTSHMVHSLKLEKNYKILLEIFPDFYSAYHNCFLSWTTPWGP